MYITINVSERYIVQYDLIGPLLTQSFLNGVVFFYAAVASIDISLSKIRHERRAIHTNSKLTGLFCIWVDIKSFKMFYPKIGFIKKQL